MGECLLKTNCFSFYQFSPKKFTLYFLQTQKPDFISKYKILFCQKILRKKYFSSLDPCWLNKGLIIFWRHVSLYLKQNCQKCFKSGWKMFSSSSAIVLEDCMFILNKICFCSLRLLELFPNASRLLFDHLLWRLNEQQHK